MWIYEVYEDGNYIGDYNTKELMEKFNMPQSSLYNAVNEGRTIRGRYKVIKADRVIPRSSPLLSEFDKTTRLILKKAGRT